MRKKYLRRVMLLGAIFAIMLILFCSCKKVMFEEVKADFEITNSPPIMKTPTYFVNKSDFATKWEWDFGDGYISNKRNPVHWYDTCGRYTVTLKAWNKKQEDIIVKDILVFLNQWEEE
jgi:hypothetical protein